MVSARRGLVIHFLKKVLITVGILGVVAISLRPLFLNNLSSKKAEENVVYVYNWAEYIPMEVLDQFTQETGIRVAYDVQESLETLEVKLFTGSSHDVVFPSAWPLFAKCMEAHRHGEHLLLPFHKALLPNMQNLDPALMGKLKNLDPQHQFGVPYLWGTVGMGMDEKAMEGFHGDLNSWSLLFSPQITKRLKGLRIQLLDSPADVFQAALLYLGYYPQSATQAQWKKAIALVASIRPYITSFDNGRQMENLLDGQSQLIQGFSTYVQMAKMQGKKSGQKSIRFVLPKEGAILWLDVMAIPKKAKHPLNAHKFINFILRKDIMAKISNRIRAANPVPQSYSLVDKSLREDPTIFPTPEVLAKIHSDILPSPELQRFLSLEWMKIKLNYSDSDSKSHSDSHLPKQSGF